MYKLLGPPQWSIEVFLRERMSHPSPSLFRTETGRQGGTSITFLSQYVVEYIMQHFPFPACREKGYAICHSRLNSEKWTGSECIPISNRRHCPPFLEVVQSMVQRQEEETVYEEVATAVVTFIEYGIIDFEKVATTVAKVTTVVVTKLFVIESQPRLVEMKVTVLPIPKAELSRNLTPF